MKNYIYDIKYVNTVTRIIDDLLRPVTKAVWVFDIKWWQNNEKKIIMTYCHMTMDIFSNFENLCVFCKDESNTKLLVVSKEHVFWTGISEVL